MMKLILFAVMLGVLPVIHIMLLNETKPKKNIILGVTLPFDARNDVSVLSLCADYRKWLTICSVFLALIMVPGLIMPLRSGEATLYCMIWLLFMTTLPYVVYTVYHIKLKRMKTQSGWGGALTDITLVDITAAVDEKRKLSAWLFVPPVILSLVPFIIEYRTGDGDFMSALPCAIMALTIACFYLFYLIINRQRADIVGKDSALNTTLTRVRRYNWSKMWLYMSWLTGVYTLLLWLFIRNEAGMLIATAVYTVLVIAASMRTEFATRGAQQKLTEQSGKAEYVDDDAYWINGIFYHNVNDRHLMVNMRTGLNMSVNLAHPVGKVMMVLAALCIVAMPFVGVWIMAEENTPIVLTVTETQIIASHTGTYVIDLAGITGISLMDSVPEGTTRTYGTGLEELLKGNFSVPGVGSCVFCLNPTVPPFILIDTEGKSYLFGASTPEETIEVYELLTRE